MNITTKIVALVLFLVLAIGTRGAYAQIYNDSSGGTTQTPSSESTDDSAATTVSDPGMPATGAGGTAAFQLLLVSAILLGSGVYSLRQLR